jgi:predicted O-linked N-acetylglucosamine transferase (SPINDLY family)
MRGMAAVAPIPQETFPPETLAVRLRERLRSDPDLAGCHDDMAIVGDVAALGAHQILDLIEKLGLGPGSLAKINLQKIWLSQAREVPHLSALIWFNLATDFDCFGDERNKVLSLQSALRLHKECHQAAVNLGLVYEGHQMADLAIATWQGALQGDATRVLLLNNIGRALENNKKFNQSKAEFSLLTDPSQQPVLHHLINLRQKTCDWPIYRDDIPGVTRQSMVEATRALSLLAMSDDVAAQARGNASWIAERMPAVDHLDRPASAGRSDKIRIGYLSTDFCLHPIAFLIAELIETHDRSAFEIYGFCGTTDDGSEVRKRIVGAFDHYVSIRAFDDATAARVIRDYRIDVLIDLNGLTLGTRLNILRWRPAPLQITYLGYNGPIPLPELDYIVADRFVIPEDVAHTYKPAPLYMPRCFQVNDRSLPIRRDRTRADVGLPADAFVFCSFSNTYKITEEMFGAWTRILLRAPSAVLWLFVDNEEAIDSLRGHARQHGVPDHRVVFARRVEASVYRGQLALADLFLDTFPYNAGTTASDALRVGLPIVTLSGASFIARMAGSLLNAMQLDDCIATSLDGYIDLAVHLCEDAEAYRALRARVQPSLWLDTLGDTPAFCRAFEAGITSALADARKKDAPTG